jgi:hypothetical protein
MRSSAPEGAEVATPRSLHPPSTDLTSVPMHNHFMTAERPSPANACGPLAPSWQRATADRSDGKESLERAAREIAVMRSAFGETALACQSGRNRPLRGRIRPRRTEAVAQPRRSAAENVWYGSGSHGAP